MAETTADAVIALAVVDSIDEAVDLANASEYSMAASLWTSDGYKALDVSARIRASKSPLDPLPAQGAEWRSLHKHQWPDDPFRVDEKPGRPRVR